MLELTLVDICIILGYLLAALIVGFRFARSKASIEEYFIAKGNIGWFVLGLAAFATNTSSGTMVGMSSSSYRFGLVVLNFELTGIIACLGLAFVFGPVFYRNNILTIPEYLEKRFNVSCRVLFSAFTIITHIFTKISLYILASVVLLENIISLDIYTLMLVVTLVTGIYSVVGGQRPIIFTEAFQAFFIIVGGFLILWHMLDLAGGMGTVKSEISADHVHMIKSWNDKDFPWLAMLVALPFIGIWYHCADAEMAQKFLAGKNLAHAQASTVFLGYLKLLVVPIILLPGMLAGIVYPGIDPGLVYPTIVENLPPVLKGIAIAGFLAAAMSSLSAAYNACSTLYTFDIYRKLYPKATPFILVNIGKIATIFIVILSINYVVLIRVIKGDLFHHAVAGFAYISPSIVTVYLLGITWRRGTALAAMTTLIIGGSIGIGLIVVEMLVEGNVITSGFLFWLAHLSFFYVALMFLAFCMLLMVTISLLDKEPPQEKIQTTLFQNFYNKEIPEEYEQRSLKKKSVIAAVLLVGIIVSIYVYFA